MRLYVKVVYTNNIYEEVGKLVCRSIEKIENIRYTVRVDTIDYEKFWLENGFEKINDNLFVQKHKDDNIDDCVK